MLHHDQATVVRGTVVRGLKPLPVALRGGPRRRRTGEGRCVEGGRRGERERNVSENGEEEEEEDEVSIAHVRLPSVHLGLGFRV